MNTCWRGVLLCLEHGVHTAQDWLPHTRVRIWLSRGIDTVPPVLAPAPGAHRGESRCQVGGFVGGVLQCIECG